LYYRLLLYDTGDDDAATSDVLNLREADALALQLIDDGDCGLRGPSRWFEAKLFSYRDDDNLVSGRERAAVAVEEAQVLFGYVAALDAVAEAVYLADEVLVMSARPGRIIDRIEIALPRPRTYEMMATDVFGRLRDRIWQQGLRVYPGWSQYERRASQRRIVIFVLEPV
jgi:hypothetical protein